MKPLLCLVILASGAAAQTFDLGSTVDDVYAKFGVPKRWWAPAARQYLNGFEEYRAAVSTGTVVQDVYERQTATNAYEIHLMRRADSRESRSSPKVRLCGLEFLAEKPRPVREMLADIAEASNICKGGCDLYGLDETNRYSILAYPMNPIAGDTEAATAAAYGYNPDFKPVHTYNWGMKLSFNKPGSLRGGVPQPDWVNSEIEYVQIRPNSSDYELRARNGQGKPQALGSWKP